MADANDAINIIKNTRVKANPSESPKFSPNLSGGKVSWNLP